MPGVEQALKKYLLTEETSMREQVFAFSPSLVTVSFFASPRTRGQPEAPGVGGSGSPWAVPGTGLQQEGRSGSAGSPAAAVLAASLTPAQ